MPTIQISKLQVRRGPAADLPNPSLDDGELGFADDVGRLFIGQTTPTEGEPNFGRNIFPWQNVEILTESSPLDLLLAPAFADNQQGFILAVPLTFTADYVPLQVYDSTDTPTNFHVNLPTFGANAVISYFVYDTSGNPIRQGRLTIIWNTNMVAAPISVDDAVNSSDTSYTDISWQPLLTGSMPNQYVLLQYINQGTTPGVSVYFRIDRPLLP